MPAHNDQNVVQQVRANSVIALMTCRPGDTLNFLAASATQKQLLADGIAGASDLADAMGVSINLSANLACSF